MNKEKEIPFFKKLIISIKDFEKYPELASKSWTKVLPYLVKLVVIFVTVVSFTSVYKLSGQVKNGLEYIKNDLPNFKFTKDYEFVMNAEEAILYENKNNILDTIIIDTKEVNEEYIRSYKEQLQKSSNGIVLLKDKFLIKTNVRNSISEYNYETIANEYNLKEFDKQQLLNYFSGANLILMYVGIFIIAFIYMYMLYFISILLDIILIGTLGFFSAIILRLHLRFSAMCKIATYSLTLPIILNAVVIIIETFTSFRVKYFEVMYIAISYIYVITAILMIKSDIIKNQKELAKIMEEQIKVRQELENKEENKEDTKDEKDKENEKKEEKENKDENVGEEPQGENA